MRKLTIHRADTEADLQRYADRGYTAATSRAEAEQLAPWAAELVDTFDGWIAYESVEDARVARQQT